MNKRYVDGQLVEWGARMFWPGNRVKGRYGGSGSALPFILPKPDQVRARIQTALKRAPQVMVKITGGGRGMGPISSHLNYISRNGNVELENDRGEKIESRDDMDALRAEWQLTGRKIPFASPRREAFNIMLSMPPATDADLVRDAARAFAREEFSNHQFAFALHRPEIDPKTERPHVHLVVRAEGHDGRRLNPRKADLGRWRERFAGALQERGVAAVATRRIVHGRLKRSGPGWHKYMAQDGRLIDQPERPLTPKEIKAHKTGVQWWGKLGQALAGSPLAQDRETALQITTLVSEMPSAQYIAEGRDQEPKKRLATKVPSIGPDRA